MGSMRVDIFSLFPLVFSPYLEISIVQRAIQSGLVEIHSHNIRDWATDRHHTTDDVPYGGGGGMVMKVEPVFAAVEEILGLPPVCPLVLMTPQGRLFDQEIAYKMSKLSRLAILCGRYEGIDERIRSNLVSDEISVGDYVVTGGELPALIVLDAIIRLIPGALGDPDGAQDDSYASGLLEYPHYTRPAEFRGMTVPEVLQSGNHAEIARWRRQQALKRTSQRRPDLLKTADLSKKDIQYLDSISPDERLKSD
jgi:tRNA (guanine37-N1)-methyltransferase